MFCFKLFHIIDLKAKQKKKLSGKPYKLIEVKKWNGPYNFCKELIVTETTISNNVVRLKI